ncbi:MAG: flagellar biosynthetic protein FliO [Lachnospiraceae bacterium]|jgi:flagellar protein FliO/FliZ|nr:flagellar biosynthetic protein FliO [Lachnospiraceae bacterium]
MILLASAGESIFELIVVLVIFVGILFLTYYTTKWIAGYQKGRMVNQNLELIETLKITNNKYVQIIRAGKDKYLVIGVGKDEISRLGELTEDEVKLLSEDASEEKDAFRNILDSFRKNHNEEDDK